MSKIEVENLSMIFGGIVALRDVSFTIDKGKIIGLIGPNGAGKTTLFNCLTGVYTPTSGTITLLDAYKEVTLNQKGLSDISKLGISRTFQNIRLFENQTVIDNVVIAMNNKFSYNLISTLFRTKKFRKEEEEIYNRSMALLERVDLADKANDLAKNLPYGEKRKLEIVRALATGADYIFLDEPAAGMNESETNSLKDFIKKIHEDFELTILLIEHDMGLVMEICDEILVLDYGKPIAFDTPDKIKNNPKVIKAYLGGDEDDSD